MRRERITLTPSGPLSRREGAQCLALLFMLAALAACGGRHGRNVFGHPEDDRLVSRCATGGGWIIALYVNTAGGAAVGTSWSVTAERKPNLAELQVMYSERPALTALKCESKGFELRTSDDALTFSDVELDPLRVTPRDLDKPVR